jgi:uncharacterized membrane protein
MYSSVFSLIVLVVDLYILYNMYKIQDKTNQCVCANTWHTKRITNVIMIIIGVQVLLLLMFMIFANNKSKTMQLVAAFLSLVLFGVHIYYAYIMVSYIMQLQNDNCSCLDSTFKTTFTVYTFVRVVMSVLAIIGLFLLIKLRNATQMSADELSELNKTMKKIKSSK